MASDEKKILLVEDEKAIRDAVAAYLEREGYIAPSGQPADVSRRRRRPERRRGVREALL